MRQLTIEEEGDFIKQRLGYWNGRYLKLQEKCPHPKLIKTHKSDTGNYDARLDSYWTEFYCPHCDKRWTENGSV